MVEGKMNIYELSVSELKDLQMLFKLADEALDSFKVINARFATSFGIGRTEIEVYYVDSCDYVANAMLSINGIWKFTDHWGGVNTWELDCSSADSILKFMKEAYLREKKDKYDSFLTPVRHFRYFIEAEKDKMNEDD